MAVTNNFNIWSSDNTSSFDESSTFNTNPAKKQGFASGATIPSRVFNTILREVSLANRALANTLAWLNSGATITLGTETNESDLTDFIKGAFANVVAKSLSGTVKYSIPYQSDSGVTGYLSPQTIAGTYLLQQVYSSGTQAPTWVKTDNLNVGTAIKATNLAAGASGKIPYQTAADTTAFTDAGINDQILTTKKDSTTSNKAVPIWKNPADIGVGYASNKPQGAKGQLLVQTAASTTGFVAAGTNGQILGNNDGNPEWINPSSIIAGVAALANTVKYYNTPNDLPNLTSGQIGIVILNSSTYPPGSVSTKSGYLYFWY